MGKWSECNIEKFVAIFIRKKETEVAGSQRFCKLCIGTTQFWIYFICIKSTSLLAILSAFKAEFQNTISNIMSEKEKFFLTLNCED